MFVYPFGPVSYLVQIPHIFTFFLEFSNPTHSLRRYFENSLDTPLSPSRYSTASYTNKFLHVIQNTTDSRNSLSFFQHKISQLID